MSENSFLSDFIVFKKFISRNLIMFIYALGFIWVTYRGIITIIKRRESLFGIPGDFSERLLMGFCDLGLSENILWRVNFVNS